MSGIAPTGFSPGPQESSTLGSILSSSSDLAHTPPLGLKANVLIAAAAHIKEHAKASGSERKLITIQDRPKGSAASSSSSVVSRDILMARAEAKFAKALFEEEERLTAKRRAAAAAAEKEDERLSALRIKSLQAERDLAEAEACSEARSRSRNHKRDDLSQCLDGCSNDGGEDVVINHTVVLDKPTVDIEPIEEEPKVPEVVRGRHPSLSQEDIYRRFCYSNR